MKLLGLKIDDILNFRLHVKDMCKKAGAKLNAIKRHMSYQNGNDRKLLVTAHVISQFQYCTNVWHFSGLTEIHKMEKVHERCIRYIYNDYQSEYIKLLIKNNLTTLYGQRIRKMYYEIYKTIKSENPIYMQELISSRPSLNHYSLRNKYDLYVPTVKQNTYGRKSFRYFGSKIWNYLLTNIKSIENFHKFKRQIKMIEMPICECEGCLTLQVGTEGSQSFLAEKMLLEKLMF